MRNLIIGNLIARFPIVQGGMGVGVSLSGLASSVANQGGIGIISLAGVGLFEKDSSYNFIEATKRAIRNEIQKAREKTKGILGVNILTVVTDYGEIVKTAIAEKIDIIFAGAGLPLDLPSYVPKDSDVKLVPIVSSARTIELICQKWSRNYGRFPDAIVLEGPEAGGHLGFKKEQLSNPNFALDKIFVDVLKSVTEIESLHGIKIPIITAGGIYTGADIHRMMKMGASGVQMGTRFVTTFECDASDAFKKMYIEAGPEDIDIINSPVGLPGRAIHNNFLQKVQDGKKHPVNCHYHCLKTCDYTTAPYCILNALLNAAKGNMESGFAFCSSSVVNAKEIISVAQTFSDIIAEYDAVNMLDPI